MELNLIYDGSVAAAPAAFKTAITFAADFLRSLILNPITVNIQVGYGEYDNGALPIGDNLSSGGALSGLSSRIFRIERRIGRKCSDAGGSDCDNISPQIVIRPVGRIFLWVMLEGESLATTSGKQHHDRWCWRVQQHCFVEL